MDKKRNRTCQRCNRKWGNGAEMHVHHIKAVADGGEDEPGNVCTLCEFCHKEWHRSWEGYCPFPVFLETASFRSLQALYMAYLADPQVGEMTLSSAFAMARELTTTFTAKEEKPDAPA